MTLPPECVVDHLPVFLQAVVLLGAQAMHVWITIVLVHESLLLLRNDTDDGGKNRAQSLDRGCRRLLYHHHTLPRPPLVAGLLHETMMLVPARFFELVKVIHHVPFQITWLCSER